MSQQRQISVDEEVYQRLQALCIPPVNEVGEVVKRLLYNEAGQPSRAAKELESELRHRTMAEERQADLDGYYVSSGIST